jgi:hypothetical protein
MLVVLLLVTAGWAMVAGTCPPCAMGQGQGQEGAAGVTSPIPTPVPAPTSPAQEAGVDIFAVHLEGREGQGLLPAADRHARSLQRRQEAETLEHRAQHLAALTGFHYVGPVGELVDYFLFAATHGLAEDRVRGPGHSLGMLGKRAASSSSSSPSSPGSAFSSSSSSSDTLLRRLSAHPDVRWVGHQVPTRRLFKRATPASSLPPPTSPPLPPSPPPAPVAGSSSGSSSGGGNRTLLPLAIRSAPGMDAELARLQGTFHIADPKFGEQWHLLNRGTVGNDLNLTGVWDQGYHGKGTTVCFLDDGLDYEHPDLKENFHAEASYDFNDHRALPTPTLFDDNHGTRCAGQVAARRNELCGVGVAWEARVSAVRILSGTLSEADEAAAINYKFHDNHIYSCSWGPPDNGKAMDAPPRIAQDAFRNGIEHGRQGLGSIYVFAAGNGGTAGDNCNYDGYTNSIYSITIGAIDEFNRHPPYSERCAAMMAVQYSSGHGARAITTTDWRNGCTNAHGGTSAAAPLVSGILAIVLGIR